MEDICAANATEVQRLAIPPVGKVSEQQPTVREESRDVRRQPLARDRTALHDEDVERLRGSVQVEHTLARRGAEKLWELLHERP